MKVQQAVAMRILALAREKGLAINALANIAGMPPMTIYSILDGKSKNPGIANIKSICDAFQIPLKDFFNDPVFEALAQEIE